METNELHRGRLIDHIQLVVRDLEASRAFYTAVLDVLQVPMGGEADGFFWADEFCVSTADSDAAQGRLTGPGHDASLRRFWCITPREAPTGRHTQQEGQ